MNYLEIEETCARKLKAEEVQDQNPPKQEEKTLSQERKQKAPNYGKIYHGVQSNLVTGPKTKKPKVPDTSNNVVTNVKEQNEKFKPASAKQTI